MGNQSSQNAKGNCGVKPCTNMNGQIHFSESFRQIPDEQKQSLVDSSGEIWIQETVTGWRRKKDNFFWPANPTDNNNQIGTLPPSVHTLAETRKSFGSS